MKDVTVVDTNPLEALLSDVNAEVAKQLDVKMEGLYELNNQRYDDEIVTAFIEKDKQERGKGSKQITGEFDYTLEDNHEGKKKMAALATLGQKKKLTMALLEKAKDHYQKTKDKHLKEQESMR